VFKFNNKKYPPIFVKSFLEERLQEQVSACSFFYTIQLAPFTQFLFEMFITALNLDHA